MSSIEMINIMIASHKKLANGLNEEVESWVDQDNNATKNLGLTMLKTHFKLALDLEDLKKIIQKEREK